MTIGVIGAGAWGTALAQVLASDGRDVVLWARDPALARKINEMGGNPVYLPGVVLHPTIRATSVADDVAAMDAIVLVTPAQAMGAVLDVLPDFAGDLVLCAKGIEAGSGRLMADVARAARPRAAIAVLSGPTFAHEVAAGLPTAVTLACGGADAESFDGATAQSFDRATAESFDGATAQWQRLAPVFARPGFRPYFSRDVVGAEIGGAVKNVLALACGVVEGLGLGQNARAALISRGFAEMVRFGLAFGAEAETLTGLSGLGDLVLTCNSIASRNFSFGRALGEGSAAADVLTGRRTVAEGAHTAPVLADLARARGIAMPIADAVAALVSGAVSARDMADALLARPLRSEKDLGPEKDGSGQDGVKMMGKPEVG